MDPLGKHPAPLFNGDDDLGYNTGTAAILDVDLDDPNSVFMPIFRRQGASEFLLELDRVNVRDGTAQTYLGGGVFSAGWVMDGRGHVVAGYLIYPHDHVVHVKVPKGKDNDSWQEITAFRAWEEGTGGVAGITEDGSSLVVSQETGQRRLGLYAIDISKVVPRLLFSDPNFDVSGVLRDDWTGRITGYCITDDRDRCSYFEPHRDHLQKLLEASFPGRTVRIVSSDVAQNAYIIQTDSPREPLTYYFLDKATMHASVIGTAYPGLPSDALGEMRPYEYKARDGLDIHAYLTLPPGSTGRNLPLVVMPHGGPAERDRIAFAWMTQFLANRGYAVFQPNFRGSSGYGRDFREAGNREWGLKVQDDITDGVQKLIADGIANPGRICIVGASFGGYAALAGAAFTPDLYACAVSIAGVSDLDRMLEKEVRDHGQSSPDVAIWQARIGDRIDDGSRIAAVSPALHADRIKASVLLLHATDDTIVPIEQSEIMRDALVKAGKNVQFIAIDGDDHQLDLAAARIRILSEIERFLDTHIGTQVAAASAKP